METGTADPGGVRRAAVSEARYGLSSGRSLWQKIKDVALTDVGVLARGGIDEEAVAELERILLEADFGVDATLDLVEELERAARQGEVSSEAELRSHLAGQIRGVLRAAGAAVEGGELESAAASPAVTMLVGVNGTGKTTTAGKFAHRCWTRGEGVILAATDTFRAGAQEQLREWAERVEAEFVGGEPGGDPAAVAYDAVEAARSRDLDRVVVDTAGRLHTARDLMEELSKIRRVVGRLVEGAPHDRLLVVDATSGQNVVRQAREFGEAVDLTGLVLAKMDSSARGGTAVAVARELSIPVRFIGTGEGPEDLEPFHAESYATAVLR